MSSVTETSLIANQITTDVSTLLNMTREMTRREAARLIGGIAASCLWPIGAAGAQSKNESATMLIRPIPSSGEKLPVIGLGTWQTFDVDPAQSVPLAEVLSAFVRFGGRVIDSSPMYGRAEQVIGDVVTKLKLRD